MHTARLYLPHVPVLPIGGWEKREVSVETRRGEQVPVYLNLWLSLLGTEITGFLA